MVDYHPLAVPVPYYHSNVDSDEVMFYCGGDYEARKGSGIGPGSISLHPGGHSHGPQPGAIERSLGVEYFDDGVFTDVDESQPRVGAAVGELVLDLTTATTALLPEGAPLFRSSSLDTLLTAGRIRHATSYSPKQQDTVLLAELATDVRLSQVACDPAVKHSPHR